VEGAALTVGGLKYFDQRGDAGRESMESVRRSDDSRPGSAHESSRPGGVWTSALQTGAPHGAVAATDYKWPPAVWSVVFDQAAIECPPH